MDYYNQRSHDLENFKYPNVFRQNTNINELLLTISEKVKNKGEINKEKIYSIGGRVLFKRNYGSKLYFYTIKMGTKKFQILCNIKEYEGNNFKEINQQVQMGDIIGAIGYITLSNTGEPSLVPTSIKLLSPCLHGIPKTFESGTEDSNNGKLVDLEVRYKKRYLDLIINDKTMDTFIKRSKIIKFIRNYLDNLEFLEVETPILSKSYGGANAKPFVTFHNDLKQDMFMRIAPELNLKQLAIGGMDKIYEIGKQFRNENMDPTHLPEFLSLELYYNYANYDDMSLLCENILSDLVKEMNGTYILKYLEKQIDFTPPFNRINIIDNLKSNGIDMDYIMHDTEGIESGEYLKNKCQELNLKCHPLTIPKMLDKLIGYFIEPLCTNPTFLMNHPAMMSPLAKTHDNNNYVSERFELFINGNEYANAYTELNDPRIQKANFEKQLKDKNNGDEEAQIPDASFVTALEYGLPPCGGLGIGIERLIMLLTDSSTIKEVTTFPPIK